MERQVRNGVTKVNATLVQELLLKLRRKVEQVTQRKNKQTKEIKMSILTVRTNTPHATNTVAGTLNNFNLTLDEFIDAKDQSQQAQLAIKLLKLYGVYSYLYLQSISFTLKANNDMKDTLTFMNSVIAEVCHKAHIAYFHKEHGYSITDKAITYIMENGEDGFENNLIDVIEEMNKELAEEAEANAMIAEAEAKLRAKKGEGK